MFSCLPFDDLFFEETEVRNAERFRALYGDQERLKVPLMFRATKKVIVMEWIDGVKLTDVEAIRSLGAARWIPWYISTARRIHHLYI